MRFVFACVMLCGCDFFFPLRDPTGVPGDGGAIDDADVGDGKLDDGQPACTLDCPGYGALGAGSLKSRYLVVDTIGTDLPVNAASAACVASGGAGTSFAHLLVLDDLEEFDRIRAVIDNSLEFWIGHRRNVSSLEFEPVTTQPHTFPPLTGSPWGSGEPQVSRDCAQLAFGATLAARDCGDSHQYICECDCFAPD